jgi:hypothetical protein
MTWMQIDFGEERSMRLPFHAAASILVLGITSANGDQGTIAGTFQCGDYFERIEIDLAAPGSAVAAFARSPMCGVGPCAAGDLERVIESLGCKAALSTDESGGFVCTGELQDLSGLIAKLCEAVIP